MPAPAVRRLALAAAPALLACALAAPPAGAAPLPESVQAVRAETGPAAADPRAADALDLEPASRVLPEPGASLSDRGRGPLVAVGLAVLALVGAFVAGLSRRPDPAG